MAKKQIDPTQETVVNNRSALALRICSRTGMGLTICRERMAGNEDKLAELLADDDIPSVMALLEPSNKA